jgi:hypothetical protein
MYLGHLMFIIHLAKYAELCIRTTDTNLPGPHQTNAPATSIFPKQNREHNNISSKKLR